MAAIVHRTPVMTSETTNQLVGKKVYFKMENQQKTGAFKFRGATFKLMQLTDRQLKKGIITASAGNHAQGVAYAARKLGAKATIYMPVHTPKAKVNATRSYGAEVVLVGESFQEAYQASCQRRMQTGATYVHPFDDYDVMAGQGSIVMELLRQEDRLDTIIVPIGGGGLISGIAVAAKHVNRNIQIIGVQAENAAAAHRSYHYNNRKKLESVSTIAEGIAVKEPGELTMPIIRNFVDDVVTVSEAEIAYAIIYMLERNKTLVEGAGAAALAALFAHQDQIYSQHCGIIVSGGNMDISTMANPIPQ
ncbi:threonine ammonia-lyase [Virgibacillus sp. 179-BFC.A HS]|uniref:L-threonine dehydratase catabolic TdcB n=1 Tax=Tigheibacillus jepli TaxID=3035914 RepID=A0ABU5CF65_9BACI|nr:threonine ammonia-lyase [Virgibacillus sp. 179-BFC.A HS]MDY0404972.1 threonine ammonia-lyase [Virgibacillus sp. 179-BFC.A HS]